MKITYKGITQNSSIECSLTDEEHQYYKELFYAKPDQNEVDKELKSIYKGSSQMSKTYYMYLNDIAAKCIGPGASWSIEDALEYKPIVEYLVAKGRSCPKCFGDVSTPNQFRSIIRLGGIRYCTQLPRFPMKTIDMLLDKYNVNGVYYDFSCGWGARMLSTMHKGIKYIGTDPNYLLTERLEQIKNRYDEVNNVNTDVTIYTQGAEKYIPQLENSVGSAFSSPPYFDLENYKIGDQSYKDGMSYQDWLDSFIMPMVKNCYGCIVNNGYFGINIKNTKAYPMLDDCKKIIEEEGFELYAIEMLNNINRAHGDAKTNGKCVKINQDEQILIFKKSE